MYSSMMDATGNVGFSKAFGEAIGRGPRSNAGPAVQPQEARPDAAAVAASAAAAERLRCKDLKPDQPARSHGGPSCHSGTDSHDAAFG